jgi:N-acylneuraminate cytidylyltransferase/CMP-N,N'-diacetyllegionaminic acid synthase
MFAIIPARGGSKGLPGKNIKNFLGKPLISHTIEAALQSEYIQDVFVSTDDEKIREIALKFGAKDIGLRPKELASDDSKSIDVYNYTISLLENMNNSSIEDICILQPTSPLRNSHDIDSAIRIFNAKNADSVVSYTKEFHPIVWHKHIDEDGRLSSIFEDNLKNRQEEEPTYFPNGAVYIFKRALLRQGIYYTERSYAYVMPRERSVDIDTQQDFDYAKFLAGAE